MFVADNEFKARGVVLTYYGGAADWCPSGQARALRLAVACDPDAIGSFSEVETVVETRDCHYKMYLKSVHGCPVSCQTGTPASPSVCNGHGVCGFDPSQETAYCVCDFGYSGSECGQGMYTKDAARKAAVSHSVRVQLRFQTQRKVLSLWRVCF